MRDIKFKAKRKDNNELVYGYLIKSPFEKYYIYPILDKRHKNWEHSPLVEVIPETICEYTGLKDKNGVEIYENDILQLFDTIGEASDKVTIKWNVESAQYEVLQLNGYHYSFDVRGAINPCKKIGNIYDKEAE